MTCTTMERLTVWQGALPFRIGFKHNLAARRQAETLVLRIVDAAGNQGYSQALPRQYLTGETLSSCLDDVCNRWFPKISCLQFDLQAGPDAWLAMVLPLYREADGIRHTASYAALEIAVFTCLLRQAAAITWQDILQNSVTAPLVGVIPEVGQRQAAWMARIFKWLGYTRIKVKVGRDEAGDARRLAAVRNVLGPHGWLAVDANQAWTAEEAVQRLAGLKHYGVNLVEEPLQPASGMTLGMVEKQTGIPVMADESLCIRADAETLLAQGSPSWWNLRLLKNGGFSGVWSLSNLAYHNGIKVYGGILVGETSCMAAAGRIAMAKSRFVCLENGFPRVLLKNDPFRGGPGGFSGIAALAGKKTLDLTLLEEKLELFQKKRNFPFPTVATR